MSYSPLTLARRHVLGDFYLRCLPVVTVPVYLNSTDGEMLGYVDESLGKYADAFTFHLSEEFCKKLSTGHFTYSFDYAYANTKEGGPASKRRIKLSSIILVARKGYERPIPKSAQTTPTDASDTTT